MNLEEGNVLKLRLVTSHFLSRDLAHFLSRDLAHFLSRDLAHFLSHDHVEMFLVAPPVV